MNKKFKILLLTSSALIANTAVASGLTSCSSKNVIEDIGGLDKKYGITMATYNRMESDFNDLYETQQSINKDKGLISEQEYQVNLLNFNSKLNSFHATLFSKDNKSLSYTIKTNALKDFANNNYGIKLTRITNINLDDELAQIGSSMLSTLLVYMEEYKISSEKASELLQQAQEKFQQYKEDAIKNIGKTDVVAIIEYVQKNMVNCFSDICEELDAIITQQQLQNFLSDYQISVEENLNKNYYWDNLCDKYIEGNKEIELNDFNALFDITSKVGPLKGGADSLRKDLYSDIIPGYTLIPILHQMNSDPYENKYSIDVDYTLIKNNYLNNNDAAKLTAHSAGLKNQTIYSNDSVSVLDINESNGEREYINYELPITKEFEEQQIFNTYFDNSEFEFTWSNSEDYGIDNFWVTVEDNAKDTLNKQALANTGMMINGYLLSDLIEEANSEEDTNLLQDKKQQAINLVKNTDFNLECSCIDNNEPNNKIEIYNFYINYIHHTSTTDEYSFIAPASLIEVVDNQINEKSGVINRKSNKLYYTIKNNYDFINKEINSKDELIKNAENVLDTLETYNHILIIIGAVVAATIFAFIVSVFVFVSHNTVRLRSAIKIYLGIAILVIAAVITSYNLIVVNDVDADNSFLKRVGSNGNCNLLTNIKKDKQIIENKQNFDNLSLKETKQIKIYYETGFLKPNVDKNGNEIKSDWDSYLGDTNEIKQLQENIERDITLMIIMFSLLGFLIVMFTLFTVICGLGSKFNEYAGNDGQAQLNIQGHRITGFFWAVAAKLFCKR